MILTTRQTSYDDLLNYINEEDLVRFYLQAPINKNFFSYFRQEDVPSARIFYFNGKMYYNDFIHKCSLRDLLQWRLRLNYRQLIEQIKKDFSNILYSTSYIKKVSKKALTTGTIIDIKARDWQDYDIEEFWGLGGITLDWLNKANIQPIDYYWVNSYINKADKFSYCYNYYWHHHTYRRKIYQPFSNSKWISNINGTIVQNWDNIPKSNDNELLIISSSYKDTGVIECNLNIPSIAPNNEMGFLVEKIIPKLNQRYKRIITWFDQDAGGHLGAKRYEQKYGFESIFIPESWAKDQFEFVSKYGKKEFIQMSNYIINETYNKT